MKYDASGVGANLQQCSRITNGLGTSALPETFGRDTVSAERHAFLPSQIKAALIDGYSLSRDCIISATRALCSDITFVPFGTVRECITYDRHDLDIVIYYAHDETHFATRTNQEIMTLRQAFSDVPIVVMSDAKEAMQPSIVRRLIQSGARGFILTRTIQMPVVSAAIRYVKEGGAVVPIEILLADGSDNPPRQRHDPLPSGLTLRQVAVLSHLRQGKANKVIAHDLHMSESTVKVHIRNIMRKMGATNRTQAVYNSNQFSDDSCLQTPHVRTD